MKLFILVGLIFALCVVRALSQELSINNNNALVCQKETGTSDEDMTKIREGKLNKADTKENVKCALLCLMTKDGFIDATGKINAEAMKAGLPAKDKKVLSDAVDKCKDQKGANPCDTAFLVGKCLTEQKL